MREETAFFSTARASASANTTPRLPDFHKRAQMIDRSELAQIAAELLKLRHRAEAAGSRGTALMIVAAARQAEQDAGAVPLADRALTEMLAEEPDEPPMPYDIDGGDLPY